MALEWQTLHLPLASGVNQKADARALPAPGLAIAHDVQLEEHGGIQTRYPYATLGASVFGGGSFTAPRRIVENGDDLVLFTKDTVYSRLASQSSWVSRGTHLAVAIDDEDEAFGTTGDQRDGDRAELNNVVLVAWVDASGLWVGARDKATRSVLMAPTLANSVGTRPRFVVCSTKILLFWVDTAANDIEVIAIDPASPATAVAGAATTVFAASNLYYDVVKIPGADTAIGANRRAVTTSYEVWKVTQALAVSSSTKARVCDGPIAVAVDPTGATAQVVRSDTTNIVGDRLTVSSLADAATGQAIGTISAGSPSQIAAAHRSTQDSGAYRCYVFWQPEGDLAFDTNRVSYNYVDTGGTIGTAAVFGTSSSDTSLALASRAFDHDGRVYVWLVFAGRSVTGSSVAGATALALQNTYFLFRDDVLLVAKAAATHAGGLAPSTGRLPHVSLVSGSTGYAWCGTKRRLVDLGSGLTSYTARTPLDITFTFDDNRARRCARLGRTMYISGAQPLQYDRTQLAEIGFNVFPYFLLPQADTGAGNVVDGEYTYAETWAWLNAQGEEDRSTTASYMRVTMAGGPGHIALDLTRPTTATRKYITGSLPRRDVWRTQVNPANTDAPMYMVTARDPSAVDPNGHQPTTDSTMTDHLDDAALTVREQFLENGAELEPLAPPPCSIIAVYGSRVFLGGIPGDRRIWYSKQRGDGQVISFNDILTFDLPLTGGALVAIAFTPDGILIAFCETAIYAVPGDGFDNLGQGSNYGPPRAISVDVGCRDHDSVAAVPMGIVFQSNKGKYLLTRGLALEYIGGGVVDYDSEPVLACHVDEALHQVRWLTGARLIVWDYGISPPQWFEWTIANGVHATVWGGAHHYLSTSAPFAQQSTYTGTSYGIHVETAWVKPADLQGAVRIRKLKILGEYRSACHVRVRLLYDYVNTVVDEKVWAPTPTTVGGPLEVEIMPSRQQCQAIKIRITVEGAATQADIETDGGGTELSAKVDLLPASDWNATLTATPLGDLGNAVTFSMAFVTSTTAAVKINNHYSWNLATSRWERDLNNLGVLVTGNDTTAQVPISDIEDAINEWSSLMQVTSAHPSPSATVSFAQMNGVETTGTCVGGAFASATGESLKLTGLALELGYQRGLFKRLPPAQRA